MAVEPGYAGFVFARSGLGIKHGIVPANCVGVIDSDYRGEVIVGLHNQSQEAFTVNPGDRGRPAGAPAGFYSRDRGL